LAVGVDLLSVKTSFAHSDIVFCGQVVSRKLTSNIDSFGIKTSGDTSSLLDGFRKMPTAVYEIKVEKIFKGKVVFDTLTILSPPTGAACGCLFKTGMKYFIYATNTDELALTFNLKRMSFDNKTFWTHQCTRTQELNKNEEDEILKEIK